MKELHDERLERLLDDYKELLNVRNILIDKLEEQKKKNIMAYTNLLYHIVFRPKNSESVIPIDKEELLYRYATSLQEEF